MKIVLTKPVLTLTASTLVAVFSFLAVVKPASARALVRESTPEITGSVRSTPNGTTVPDTTAIPDGLPATVSAATVSRTGPTPSVPSPTLGASNSATPNLAYQLQQLRQEVSGLRGLVEEQGHELRRLKQQRLDDYLDLDKRLSELSANSSAAGFEQSPANNTGLAGAGLTETGLHETAGSDTKESATKNRQPGNTAALLVANAKASAEKALYTQAIDQLLKQQDYPAAKEKFSEYLATYPAGVYVPNVYYWQGQILLIENDKNAAAEVFKTLVDKFPDHRKTPDAKYKLATIYFDQGKQAEAKVLLDEVAAGNSDASRLAKSFLSSQYN